MHVVVTGASAGIGEALARAFSAGGHGVTLVARRRPLLEALAASLPGPSHVVEADLGIRQRARPGCPRRRRPWGRWMC
ncbi:MAG: SDR family NAD(P)-dependent oxidoreductase [bacterium]